MCQYVFALYIVFGLRSVMATALDSDESLHSEVGLRQERESTSDLDIIQSAYGRTNYLKRRRQREKALRSGESADDRLERLQRKAQHERHVRTIESANDRLQRLQRKAQHERQASLPMTGYNACNGKLSTSVR